MEHTQFYVALVLVYDRNGWYYPDQRDYFVFLVLFSLLLLFSSPQSMKLKCKIKKCNTRNAIPEKQYQSTSTHPPTSSQQQWHHNQWKTKKCNTISPHILPQQPLLPKTINQYGGSLYSSTANISS